MNINKPEHHLRVLSIDPSTSHVGITVMDVNVKAAEKFKLVLVKTIHGEKVAYDVPERFNSTPEEARTYGIIRAYEVLLSIYEPDVVICEDNFLGKDPSAFKKLVKVVMGLREVTLKFNKGLNLYLVLPRLAKETVVANFSGSQKVDVLNGVLAYEGLDHCGINVAGVDEHSSDSIAIALFMCELIQKDYLVELHHVRDGKVVWKERVTPNAKRK